MYELTPIGLKVSDDRRSLLLKSEPVLEIVAGLTDGSISSLMVILSSFFANLSSKLTIFTALLTLTSVAITNFSSFFLGGATKDISGIIAIKKLIDYGLSGNPDKGLRLKLIELLKCGFSLLNRDSENKYYLGNHMFHNNTICRIYVNNGLPNIFHTLQPFSL